MAEIVNLWDMKKDIEEKRAADAANNADNFDKEKMMTLTDEERAAIDKMIEEQDDESPRTEITVHETSSDGSIANTPITEYTKSLDNRVAELQKSADTTEVMKLVNSGDINKTVEQLKEEGRTKALAAFRSMSIDSAQDITDDDYLAINDAGIAALQKYFGMERLDSDIITKKLMKLSLKQIAEIFPKQFLDIYVTPEELAKNSNEARERFITTIAYLTVTGPELDYLNEYIDNENKLMIVSNRLMQCQSNFLDMIKDPAKMSDIMAKTVAISPVDESFWAKYIKGGPKMVHNRFAQNAVIQDEYRKAYEQVLEEYPELPETDPEYEIREKSRELILTEIEEATNKYAAYTAVTNLELMKRLWDILTNRYKNNKKCSFKYLQQEAVDALERIRRAKQNVPFPVYDVKFERRPVELYKHYMEAFPNMLKKYNEIIVDIRSKNADQETEVVPIQIDGINDDAVLEMFSMMLLILYGRIMKNLTSNTSDKYDAIMLDAYFQIYCQLGSDIYLMTDIWNMMKEFIDYAIGKWCVMKASR